MLYVAVAALGCSNHKLRAADAQRMIESSARFTAPDVISVCSGIASKITAPGEDPGAGLARLKALQDSGAIRIERRAAAAPGRMPSTPGPMREWLLISLTNTGNGFHPRALPEGSGWEFTRAQRRFISWRVDVQ